MEPNSNISIIEELEKIYYLTEGLNDKVILQDHSENLETFFQRLDYLSALEIDDLFAQDIVGKLKPDCALESIVRFRNLYSLRLETENAYSILAGSQPWEVLEKFTHYSNYIQLARSEYQGSGLKPGDCVVFLGSGPLPLSLIIMCHQNGLKGVGIEQEPDRAKLSRKVVDKLGLSNAIKIIHGNHFQLPLSEGADLIMIAAQAQPKKEIVEQLAKALPAGTKISCRIYEKGLRRLLDRSILVDLPAKLADEFKECCRIHPLPPVNNTVVFAVRSSAAAPERQ